MNQPTNHSTPEPSEGADSSARSGTSAVAIRTPYADVLPPLTTEERETLRLSVEAEGVRVPCVATEDGRLLDGHHRRGIDPDAPVQMVPMSADWTDDECLAWMFRNARERRNLSPDQKAEVRKQEVEAARRLYATEKYSQEQLGELFGVAQRTMSDWLSTDSGSAIGRQRRVRLIASDDMEILARHERGESLRQIAADKGVVHQTIDKRLRKLKATAPPGPPAASTGIDEGYVLDLKVLIAAGKKYGTIYADPPWKYGNQATRAATDNHYPTMTLDDIAALPVRELAADCCHLHLWTTNAFLFECPRLMEAWGFDYQGVFVWCKEQMGIGNCWRVSHEFMILAIKGEPRQFAVHDLKSYLECPRGAHSAKPERVRDMIERASPGPRLELFGRGKRSGWMVWGNTPSGDLFTHHIGETKS